MKIKNLTNSPFDLINSAGLVVRLPARGEVTLEPHSMHAAAYRSAPYLQITEEGKGSAAEYESLTGKPADGRWSESRLREEIEKIKG